ncbi:unnamed protein product [Rhodiola kirilowii]
MDVKSAFLNGHLEEEIYMKQPEGFIMSGQEHKFSMKDMGEAEVILGIRINRVEGGLALTQSHYIENVLKKFNYMDCYPLTTPYNSSTHLYPNKGKPKSQLEYAKVIGSLMYAMNCTRPDIAFAVGKFSRYTSNPSMQHWKAIHRVLRYLKGTMNLGLVYSDFPSVIEGYSDASWISNQEDHSSTSGWVFYLGEVSFYGHPRNKLASQVLLWNLSLLLWPSVQRKRNG